MSDWYSGLVLKLLIAAGVLLLAITVWVIVRWRHSQYYAKLRDLRKPPEPREPRP